MAMVSMVCYVGCKDASDPISVLPPIDETPLTKDDSVIVNVYLVRDAAEAFAAANNGVYPFDLRSETPDGRRLMHFLPGEQQLVNPYTYVRNIPFGHDVSYPGQVGIRVYTGTPPYGYHITGVGPEEFFHILTITKRTPL